MNFSDQYKRPEWQKKRLEALQKAEFTCERCGDGESQLQVHHKVYIKGRMIWEYRSDELEVLCNSCHEMAHDEKVVLNQVLMNLCADAIPEVIGLVSAYCDTASMPVSNHDFSGPISYVGDDSFGVVIGKAIAEIARYCAYDKKRISSLGELFRTANNSGLRITCLAKTKEEQAKEDCHAED